jgi:hypothetical protein
MRFLFLLFCLIIFVAMLFEFEFNNVLIVLHGLRI